MMSEWRWKEQWDDHLGRVTHVGCNGSVLFSAPDSEGTPLISRCLTCGATWRKAYGWKQERCTGLHREGLPDPPNLRPEEVFDNPARGWRLEIEKVKDVADLLTAQGRTVAALDCHVEGPRWLMDTRGRLIISVEDDLVVCWEDDRGVRFELGFNCHIASPDERDRHLDVVLEPRQSFLAIADRREARAALSAELGDLGDLAWASWQKAHPEGGE